MSALATRLRELIYEAASEVAEIGPLTESIKWGQPSFAPEKRGIGSSVRLEERSDGHVGLMFICSTNLVERFRTQYDGELAFEGNRAIIVTADKPLPVEPLKHCIAQALTYKLTKRRSGALSLGPDR